MSVTEANIMGCLSLALIMVPLTFCAKPTILTLPNIMVKTISLLLIPNENTAIWIGKDRPSQ